MTATQIETVGFAQSVLDLLEKERSALSKGGLAVDIVISKLTIALEQARAANAAQESLKNQLKAATRLTEVTMESAYSAASSALDMAMGSVNNTSDTARVFQRLRSKMRLGPRNEISLPLPVPNPAATD